MRASELTPGTRIVVTEEGRGYTVTVKEVTRPSKGALGCVVQGA